MHTRIQLRHPDPSKRLDRIDRNKYEAMKSAILESIRESPDITFSNLLDAVVMRLGPGFDGSHAWYCTCVKLDLEARGMIRRSGRSPQRLELGGRRASSATAKSKTQRRTKPPAA